MQTYSPPKMLGTVSTNPEALNETADSSQYPSLGLDTSNKANPNQSTIPLENNTGPRQNPPIIVHPSYSRPSSVAFDYSGPPMGIGARQSQSFNSSRESRYLPHLQYGGVLEEMQSRDRHFKIQMIENELNQNQHSCYKISLLFQIVLSVLIMIGLFWSFTIPLFDVVPAWTTVISILLTIWNDVQLFIEFQAIRSKSFQKAERALKSFCLFMLVLFISNLVTFLAVQENMFPEFADGARVTIAIVCSFAIEILFYVTIMAGAVKVYQILRRKQDLQNSLDEEARLSNNLRYI